MIFIDVINIIHGSNAAACYYIIISRALPIFIIFLGTIGLIIRVLSVDLCLKRRLGVQNQIFIPGYVCKNCFKVTFVRAIHVIWCWGIIMTRETTATYHYRAWNDLRWNNHTNVCNEISYILRSQETWPKNIMIIIRFILLQKSLNRYHQ